MQEHGRSFIFTKVVNSEKKRKKRKENVRGWAFALVIWKRGRWPGRDNERSM